MRLLVDLVSIMTRDTPSVEHLVAVVRGHLAGLGLREVTVFTLDPDDGSLLPIAGPADARAELVLAGRVFRAPAGGAPVRDGDRMAVRLRVGGQTVGVLVLTGGDPAALHSRTRRWSPQDRVLAGQLAVEGALIVAVTPDGPVGVATLMRGADAAMYRAKRAGGGIRRAR